MRTRARPWFRMELGLEMELTYARGTPDMVNALTRVARVGTPGSLVSALDAPLIDAVLYEVMAWAFGWQEWHGSLSNLHLEVLKPERREL